MSRLTTSTHSSDTGTHAWRRIWLALLVSIPVGIPVYFYGIEYGYISSGDEGWALYPAAAGLLWATLVFAFVHPAARERWGRRDGAVASALTGIAACLVVFGSSVLFFLILLVLTGYEV